MQNIYWIRHAESCANVTHHILEKIRHPSLTNIGINQAILLGIEFYKKNLNFNIGFSSPLARTIMTSLLSLRSFYNKENFKIEIIPYISEEINYAGSYDRQNNIMHPIQIKLIIELIKDWLDNFWLIEYDDIEFYLLLNNIIQEYDKNIYVLNVIYKISTHIMDKIIPDKKDLIEEFIINFKVVINSYIDELISFIDNRFNFINLLEKFKDSKFLRGPKIDLSTYTEEIYEDDIITTKNSINRFNIFYTLDKIKEYNNIICFSHGNILKNKFGFDKKLKNTSIILEQIKNYEEEDDFEIIDGNSFRLIYPNGELEILKENHTEYHNIIKLINNIKEKNDCFIDNKLNRAINKIGNIDKTIFKLKFNLADNNTPLSIITSKYNNVHTFYNMIDQLKSKNIYEQKYLKYKNKYLIKKLKIN